MESVSLQFTQVIRKLGSETSVVESAARFMAESRMWIILWLFCFLLFVLYPVICHDRNRRRCIWRIMHRRWDISEIERRENESMINRPIGAIHENINNDWQMKQVLILENLADYTLQISKDDIIDGSQEAARDDRDLESQIDENDDIGDDDDDESTVVTTILTPRPGEPVTSSRTNVVSTECAICLSPYNVGDRICWSSNATCPHVYHEHCIIQWLVALLTKQKREYLHRRRIENQSSPRMNNLNNNQQNLVSPTPNFPSSQNATPNEAAPQSPPLNSRLQGSLSSLPRSCPCCRQDFIVETSTCGDSDATKDKFDTFSLSIGTAPSLSSDDPSIGSRDLEHEINITTE